MEVFAPCRAGSRLSVEMDEAFFISGGVLISDLIKDGTFIEF